MRPYIPLSTLVLMLFVSTVNVPAEDVDWTGWLGPNRDGWVDYFQPPAKWPENLQQQWQVTVGEGYATPLVSAGRVYQYARINEEETLWCLDLKTGNTIWKQSWPVPFKMGGGGEWHGKGPKAAPILHDGRLFAMGISGILTAWDANSGAKLWQQDHSSEYEKLSHPYWGACTSPVAVDDRVMVHFGNDDHGVLVAHDVSDGEAIWKQDKDAPSYSSPLVVNMGEAQQIVEWNHRALVGIDIATGEQLWDFPFEHVGTNQNMPTPIFHNGRIIVGGENRGIRGVEPTFTDGQWNAKELWHQTDVALDMSSAVINDKYVYGFSHYGKGRLFCLDPANGKIMWQSSGRTAENVTFLSIPGYVLALLDKGELRVIKATPDEYALVAEYQVADSPTWAAPTLLSDGMLVKDREKLTLWKME